jgi:4-aminobutyrate aminotransferase-like enzyme
MRERGILISATGPAGNVLKIRPPLVFRREHADLLLETLDEVLATARR